MAEGFPEELIERMMPALSELAGLIGDGIRPDRQILTEILSKVGLSDDKKALAEFGEWCEILQKVNTPSDEGGGTEPAVAALQARGVLEAPAKLAAEQATVKPLKSKPDAVDFGILKPGEAAQQTLEVSGRLKDARSNDKRLHVAWKISGPQQTLVKIMVQPSAAGERLNSEVVLQGEREEIKVPISARWVAPPQALKREQPKEPTQLQLCPICQARGTHGEGSLWWNPYKKQFECLNARHCGAYGPSPDRLRRPPQPYTSR